MLEVLVVLEIEAVLKLQEILEDRKYIIAVKEQCKY